MHESDMMLSAVHEYVPAILPLSVRYFVTCASSKCVKPTELVNTIVPSVVVEAVDLEME